MMQTSLGSEQSAARQPLLSIGLPVHNGANFLAETLRSIASQTFTDFELIIADNASTDATASICLEFARLDPRVRYVRHPENVGAAANFNLVLELARAPLFKWHAHDDQLEPDFLERSVVALTADPAAISATTAPISDSPPAILKPPRMNGSAAGSFRYSNVCSREAP